MTENQKIVDWQDNELGRGMYATIEDKDGNKHKVFILDITDYDVDYNDDLGRPEMYPPKVTIRYADNSVDELYTSMKDRDYRGPDEPEFFTFECEELEAWTG